MDIFYLYYDLFVHKGQFTGPGAKLTLKNENNQDNNEENN